MSLDALTSHLYSFSRYTERLIYSAQSYLSSRDFQDKAPFILAATTVGATSLILYGVHKEKQVKKVDVRPESIVIRAPQRELQSLEAVRAGLGGQLEETHFTQKVNTQAANEAYLKMNRRETFVSYLPSFLWINSVAALVLGADKLRINAYHEAVQAQRRSDVHMKNTSADCTAINRQIDLTHELTYYEGSIISQRRVIQAAQEALANLENDQNKGWSELNRREKMIYYLPLDIIRNCASRLLWASANKVNHCVHQGHYIANYHELIDQASQQIDQHYQSIFSLIAEKFALALPMQKEKVEARDLLRTYKLAAKLEAAANNAWEKLASYQRYDIQATKAETKAARTIGLTEKEKEELKSQASSARHLADWARHSAQNQISHVQTLAKELDASISVLRRHLSTSLPTQSLSTPLRNANSSLSHFDFWEKLTGCNTWSSLYNVAEALNLLSIQGELDQIARNASHIYFKLESVLVPIFQHERSLHAEEDLVAQGDALSSATDRPIRAFLRDWAEPGIFDRFW